MEIWRGLPSAIGGPAGLSMPMLMAKQRLFYNARIVLIQPTTVKFILDNIFLVGLAVVSGAALLVPAMLPSGRRGTVIEITTLINRSKTIVLDVRTAEEYATGHLPDAKNIPLAELGQRVGELEKSKNRTIVLVCERGARADKAARQLKAAGFEDVISLEGGMQAWQAAGMPITK
jgi:rhodanese-related sulfurtransferase